MQGSAVRYQTFHSGVILGEFGNSQLEIQRDSAPSVGWVMLPELAQPEVQAVQHVGLFAQAGGLCLARACVLPARESLALRKLSVSESALAKAALITNVVVTPGYEHLLPAVLYAAGRRARMSGAKTLLGAVADLNGRAATLLGLRPTPHGKLAEHTLAAQRLDLWMHRTWAAMVEADYSPDPKLLAAEVEETIRSWTATGHEWSFFKALREQRLTREQYVYTLSNLYQFVRHTTRVIGRAIGHSVDPDLRKHWINHLSGEVNHEIIIERDLKHLGEDVAYVMRHMAPAGPTQEFMAIQESMIGYYNDPVLMMASPLAAEAVTAHLDQRFADDLVSCVASWGVQEPKRACQFLISHMNTDGGEDGHWRMTIDALPKLVQDEARLSLFLTTNGSSRRAIQGVFNACVDDMAIWSA